MFVQGSSLMKGRVNVYNRIYWFNSACIQLPLAATGHMSSQTLSVLMENKTAQLTCKSLMPQRE